MHVLHAPVRYHQCRACRALGTAKGSGLACSRAWSGGWKLMKCYTLRDNFNDNFLSKLKIVFLRPGQLSNTENELHTKEQPTHLDPPSAICFSRTIRLNLGRMPCEETYWSLTNLGVILLTDRQRKVTTCLKGRLVVLLSGFWSGKFSNISLQRIIFLRPPNYLDWLGRLELNHEVCHL